MSIRKLLLEVLFAASLLAECRLPDHLFDHRLNDLFNDAREADLGDAIAEEIGRDAKIVEAPEETALLSQIAAQLLSKAPATGVQFRFFLIDAPEANAFSVPGGRIYVTRKLIAAMRSPDEMAGIVGHEMGHSLAHQEALEISEAMREVLKVKELRTRDDVFRQYALLREAYLKPDATIRIRHVKRDQEEADRISVSLLVAAGYDPESLVNALDRITGANGNHGSLFSDFFGLTPPEGKRIRDLVKTVDGLPANCVQGQRHLDAAAFQFWQDRVVKLTSTHGSLSLPGLIAARQLTPPLTSSMSYVHFSPDGKYALAQDEATIHVLSVSPFALLFDISGADAQLARFSPDSKFVSFVTRSLRAEKWSVVQQQRVRVRELQAAKGCWIYRLSPDGDLFACLEPNRNLKVIQSESGETVFEKDTSTRLDLLATFAESLPPSLDFSPDGAWLLLTSPLLPASTVLFNTHLLKSVKVPFRIQEALEYNFDFVANDRVMVRGVMGKPGSIIEIPSGQIVEKLVFPVGFPVAMSDPDLILFQSSGKYAAVVVKISEKAVILGSASPGLDIHNGMRITETRAGQLHLTSGKTDLGLVTLQNTMLGSHVEMAASPSLDWISISSATRAAIWNTQTGNGYLTGPLEHAEITDPGFVKLVTAPAFGEKPIFGNIDLSQRAFLRGGELKDDPGKPPIRFWNGPVRIVLDADHEYTAEAHQPEDSSGGWSAKFKSQPLPVRSLSASYLAFTWPAGSAEASEKIEKSAELKKEKEQATWEPHVLEIRDAQTGAVLKRRVVSALVNDAPQVTRHVLQPSGVTIASKWAVLREPSNRIAIENWEDGKVLTHAFGQPVAFHEGTETLVLQNRDNELKLLDLSTKSERETLQFPERVAAARFRSDGQQLAVVTADQKVYLIAIQK